jgi:hypothetical protein
MLRGSSGTLFSVRPSSVALCLDYAVSAAGFYDAVPSV